MFSDDPLDLPVRYSREVNENELEESFSKAVGPPLTVWTRKLKDTAAIVTPFLLLPPPPHTVSSLFATLQLSVGALCLPCLLEYRALSNTTQSTDVLSPFSAT